MTTEYSARDRNALFTFYVIMWKSKGLALNSFDDYWRDVHGPVCARLPGQFQYWQWHVGHNEGGIFPALEGVDYASKPQEQFDAIAELTFESTEDRQTWFDASAILMNDEHNIFSKAIGYVTKAGNSRTYTDRIEVGDPNGGVGLVKFHVMLRQAQGIATEDFREYLTASFAHSVVKDDRVPKFRLHLFEPPDVSRPDAAGVSHSEPQEMLYQAAFEIAFKNQLDMEAFFASEHYSSATEELAKTVSHAYPFPERDSYTFVYNGKMTLAGRRGSRTAELITHLGAVNQLRDDISELLGIREPNL
jgi:hypothetical protein